MPIYEAPTLEIDGESHGTLRLATTDEVTDGPHFERVQGELSTYHAVLVLTAVAPICAQAAIMPQENSLAFEAGQRLGRGWNYRHQSLAKTAQAVLAQLPIPLAHGLGQLAAAADRVELYYFTDAPTETWICVAGYRDGIIPGAGEEQLLVNSIASKLCSPSRGCSAVSAAARGWPQANAFLEQEEAWHH